jgi:hypothetical protein
VDADTSSDSDLGEDGGLDDRLLNEEIVCDGLDDDGNGIVDDVDKGRDGVCDCLRIATLGLPGVWGEGDVFEGWLEARSDDSAVDFGNNALTPEMLLGIQILVLLDISEREITSEAQALEAVALTEWLEAGGGMVTLIGYQAGEFDVIEANAFLAPLGLAYDTEEVLHRSGDQTAPVSQFAEHPVFEGVSALGVDNGKEPIGSVGEVVAAAEDIRVARSALIGDGKVFMWGDEWISYDSEWENTDDYQVERFWLNLFKWLSPEKECQVPVIVI